MRRPLPVLAQAAPERRAASVPPADAPGVGVVTLGCDKNTVDTERLLARLAGAGTHVIADAAAADILIVNTCGFIDIAREESVDAILDAVRLKQAGRVRAVVAMGCLVQRYRAELEAELPEVDLFLGVTEAERLVPELRARGILPQTVTAPTMEQPLRILSTTRRYTSYLKISEGCDHTCAFCAIPLMRGRHRSAPMDVLVREAQELEAAGVVELNIISQDTTWYGRDLQRGIFDSGGGGFVGRTFPGMAGVAPEPVAAGAGAVAAGADWPVGGIEGRAGAGPAGRRAGLLPELLHRLLRETGVPWYRLFYMYPSGIGRALVELMATEPRIVPYLDMPIQHGADSVLQRMRRPERQATIRERVAWLRAAVPELALRTTVIVGFPGESDAEFEQLIELLEEIRFDHLGAFAYSVEAGTRAAALPDAVPDSLIRERMERLLEVQQGISHANNEAWIGRDVRVLIDDLTGRALERASPPAALCGAVGRTARQALEIDGVVHIADARGAAPGMFVQARITDVIEQDLRAEIRHARDAR